MVCEYDDGNGWCTGRYRGFGCIKDSCEVNNKPENGEGNCADVKGDGVYCHRFNRFYCAGKENCTDNTSYLRDLKKSMC